MDKNIGIVKELDKLGRIVIPKELRDRFGITKEVEMIATEFGILVKSPEYMLIKISNDVESQLTNNDMCE